MKLSMKKCLSIWIVACFLTGLVFPSIQPVFAASNNVFNPAFTYNEVAQKWDIDWVPIDGSKTVTVTWHEPDGSSVLHEDMLILWVGTKNRVSFEFDPDHIYDLTFSFKNESGNTINFRNMYNEQNLKDTVFFLADMTFEGTSFNDMAILGGLSDGAPNLELNSDGTQVIRIISGQKPQISLRWKIPTIWQPTGADPQNGVILPITHENVDLNRLESGATPHVDMDYSYFHIKMNEVKDIITGKDYRTTYDNENNLIVRETGDAVQGIDQHGNVTTADGFVSYTLDQNDGIIPGTEYEKINIRLFFWNSAVDAQAISSRLVYGTKTSQGFEIENKDNVFQTIEGRLDSIFTPMMFEVGKVDVNKLEIRIYKIKSRNYTELYYEVQDASTIVELLDGSADLNSGIKVPDTSIPSSTGWGSVIIEIPLDQNGQHPEHYYRVVVTDGNAHTPLGSLAIDLRTLGNDTGKPPVPGEIQVQPIYDGKQNVIYKNPAKEPSIRIPSTDVRISFEKPLLWRTQPWADIHAAPEDPNDFTFHILLNTYLSDNIRNVETREIGDEKVTVFVPVKEKRVLTIGKNALQEDPNDSSRVFFEMDGTALFYDHALDKPLEYENNMDTDMNGRPDYPTFLVPNTTYYLRMFSTRLKDNDAIDWAGQQNLGDKISYISPVVSFTTYPNRDLPLPLPNITLDVDLAAEPDPITNKPVFNGITVDFPKILDDNDWLNYTNIMENRKTVYDLYIGETTDEASFRLLKPPYMETLQTIYPDENPNAGISALVDRWPVGQGETLKPNTTYYFKLQAKLYVNDEADPFLLSDYTPIKSITTPKTDSGSMDDLDRKPRTPVEFSIAADPNGELELTDARVTLNWLHAEQDVTYELVCTTNRLKPDADKDAYIHDAYHIGDTSNPGFLRVYHDYKPNAADDELNIDVLTTRLKQIGFTYNEGYTRIAKFPINLRFLKPNRLYYFSIRAVRNRGTAEALYSEWVSIPVTTKAVAPPDFLETVNDVQLGFKLNLPGNINEEEIKIQLKKSYEAASSYVEPTRAKYSVVKDGSDYYFRIFDLDPNTWYDIQPFYKTGSITMWYDNDEKDWDSSDKGSLRMKTRNTLNEIEVRFAGETLYDYFLEIRTDRDSEYVPLQYHSNASDSDYGYTLEDGTRVEYYREKISAYVEEGLNSKYIYYAKISSARQRKSDGVYQRNPLAANTRYYIKAWAHHISDSNRIGPVTIRTDFSQDDYDKEYIRDELTDSFQTKADKLTKKLYFTINEPDQTANRVLLKAIIANRMQVSGHSGVVVDISAEKPKVSKDIILIPMEILTALQKQNSRLTIKLQRGELILTAESIDTEHLKQLAAATGVKEAMLEVTVHRKTEGPAAVPQGLQYGSPVFDISFSAVGMKRTYAEINETIYDILKEPRTAGPFKYGMIDRELQKLLENKTTMTYLNPLDLENHLNLVIERIEEELSLYIKDILDGGRGFSASRINRREIPELSGGMKLKVLHTGSDAMAEPYVLLNGQRLWQEPRGIKAWVFPYVLMTVKVPGHYAVFLVPGVIIPDEAGAMSPDYQRLAQKYNLQKVFGSRTLYPGDFVTGEKAVYLFEAVTETGGEVVGLSFPAKLRYYQLDGILTSQAAQRNVNREQAASLAVEIYAYKTGITSDMMRPSIYQTIKDSAAMSDDVYHRLVVALDLGIIHLEADKSFDGSAAATVGELLNEIVTVLELLGEW